MFSQQDNEAMDAVVSVAPAGGAEVREEGRKQANKQGRKTGRDEEASFMIVKLW